jgi:ribonuclease G
VLLPGEPHLGISRRIDDEEDRQRLRDLLEPLLPPGHGLIVRTAGALANADEFEKDLAYLTKLRQRIYRRAEKARAPALIHHDLDLSLRIVRDYFSEEFSVLWVDGEDTYERIVDFVDQVQPELLSRVRLGDSQLMDRFGINAEIEAALATKVWLKSGGHIVIHPTEALVAIDVNTGRYVGRHNLEDTVLTTNLEAVKEIVRQIRLRNLGGIIVLDLIDMVEPAHREQVFEALAQELAKDRARNKVLSISEFGLVEITRKRTRPSLERLLTQPCPYCRGVGRIKSLNTIAMDMRRQLLSQRGRFIDREVMLRVHPDVARALQREQRPILDELEHELDTAILLQSDPQLHHERFDILEV